MATIIVDTTVDENDGSIADGDVSLRDAILAASSGDTISFASGAGEAFETGGTIRLNEALGELVIASDVTIEGDTDGDPASRNITIDAQRHGRVLNVTDGSSTIDGLVITGGYYSGNGDDGAGVLIANVAALVVSNSSVLNNGDGGISNGGTLTLTNTTVSDNSADRGGGIDNSGTATLTNTTVSGNSSWRDGGGINNGGTLTLTNTTVSGNSADDAGGGIDNRGTATLINTTVSDNGTGGGKHGDAGGIMNRPDAILTLTDTLVSGNSTTGRYGGADRHAGVGQQHHR